MNTQKINYFSLDELDIFDARLREDLGRPFFIYSDECMAILAARADRTDPEGEEAHAIAARYRPAPPEERI